MNRLDVVNVENVKDINFDRPYQSANCLFHFVKKLEFIKKILQEKCLKPWYVKEDVKYLGLEELKDIYIPMKCFCDINLHKLEKHIEFYGNYGIAFSKNWGVNQKIQPLIYVNEKSFLIEEYKNCLNRNMKAEANNIDVYPLVQLMYIKPLTGMQKKQNGDVKHKFFTDECEWRYIFDMEKINSEYRQIYTGHNVSNLDLINESLQEINTSTLNFGYNDIKYIIVKTEDDFIEVQQLIEQFDLNQIDKYKLVSKLIIWDESMGDF